MIFIYNLCIMMIACFCGEFYSMSSFTSKDLPLTPIIHLPSCHSEEFPSVSSESGPPSPIFLSPQRLTLNRPGVEEAAGAAAAAGPSAISPTCISISSSHSSDTSPPAKRHHLDLGGADTMAFEFEDSEEAA